MKRLSLLSVALLFQSCAIQTPHLAPNRTVASEPIKDGCIKTMCVGDEVLLRQGHEVNKGFGVVKEIFEKKKETYAKVELRNKTFITERIFSFARVVYSPAGECFKTPTREYCVGDLVGVYKSEEVNSDNVMKMNIVGLPDIKNESWDLLYMTPDKKNYSFSYYPVVFKKDECSADNICIGQTFDNGFGSKDEIVGLFDDFVQFYGQGRSYIVKLGDFNYPMIKRIPMQLLKTRMNQEYRRELTMENFYITDQKLSTSEEEILNQIKLKSYSDAKSVCSREFYGQGVLDEERTTALPDLNNRCKKKIEVLTTCILPVLSCPKFPTRTYTCENVNWKFTCVHMKKLK
jgi:hypothetical protein